MHLLTFLSVRDIQRTKPDLLVATPGRLIDLIENYGLQVQNSARYLILDEGDAMLDYGFEKELDKLINRHLD